MSTMAMKTDPFQLLSALLAYSGHDVAAGRFALVEELVPLIKTGWLAPAAMPETVLCEACDDAHNVDVVYLDGVLSGVCLRTGDKFTVSQIGRLYRVDGDAIAQSLAQALHLDGAARRLHGFEALWTLGGRRLDDRRVVFFFTTNLDRFDVATSLLRTVVDQSHAMTSILIVSSDRVDHVSLLVHRHRVVRLCDIAEIDAGGRLAIEVPQLVRLALPEGTRPNRSGRRPVQRDRIFQLLDELVAGDAQIPGLGQVDQVVPNETCRLVQHNFSKRFPDASKPQNDTVRSAIAKWKAGWRGC